MKNILIIEDESIAVQNLRRLLADYAPDYSVAAVLQSIEESVEYFQQNAQPDLCFMDIHLADGLAFRIFEQTRVECPIIFTTAYDQYALQAFKVNSIDYLLKPINKDDLRRAIDKASRLINPVGDDRLLSLLKMLRQQERQYQSSFLIPLADQLVPIQVANIACFYLQDKSTQILTLDGRSFTYDKPLDLVMDQVNPDQFFRANRQYIIAHAAIKEIFLWPIGKLAIRLCYPTPERIIIPKARTHDFKEWYSKR